ncbi:response regulator transcription factor [Granulicella sp. L60]|uniref:response regulator n=1 Tax=Granulicella sp. L60 TaxID=1641866 RepID=UPI00131A7B0E|nr:response regulator transcription factor [Granulicella sp. L60]
MTTDRQIKVLIVDDHPLMRAGIAGEINAQRDMRVVAEGADGESAIELFRRHLPDITLMDLKLPHMNGIDCMTIIRTEFRHARIIVLTSIAGDVQMTRAFKAGAVGFLLKDTLRADLVNTIRLVHAGGRKIPEEIAQQIAEHAGEDILSTREIEVLRCVARGQSNKIIADKLTITEHTVKNHLKNILSKLNADDRTHAVTIALKRGYIDL